MACTRRKGRARFAGLLLAAVLGAVAWGCGAVSAQALEVASPELAYDNVVWTSGERAVVTKQVGEAPGFAGTWPVYQVDLVDADGKVLFASRYSGSEGETVPTYDACSDQWIDYVHGTVEETPSGTYVRIAAKLTPSGNAGDVYGLMDLDGKMVVQPVYLRFLFADEAKSYVVGASMEGGPHLDLISLPTGNVVDTVTFDEGVELGWYSLYSEAGGYIEVSPTSGGEEAYYTVAGNQLQEVSPDNTWRQVANGVSSTGVPFEVVCDGETLTVTSSAGTVTVTGTYYNPIVEGDYVIADQGGSTFVMSFTGEQLPGLSGYMPVNAFADGQHFLCRANGEYVITDKSGAVTANLPASMSQTTPRVAGDYVYATVDGTLEIVDAAGKQVTQLENMDGSPIVGEASVSTWSAGYLVGTNNQGQSEQRYFDENFTLLRSNGRVSSDSVGTLPDGSELYTFSTGFDAAFSEVVDARLQQVELGGYGLAIPSGGYCTPRRGDDDAFYARNDAGKYGLVSAEGTVLLPFEYDSVADSGSADSPYFMVKKDGAWYFMNMDATEPYAPQIEFTDVMDATPHAGDIRWLAENGISTGWDNGDGTYHFSGMSTVVRQDMAAFLHRLAIFAGASLQETVELTFSDVTDATPHADDIRWLAATGVSQGWRDEGKGTYHFSGMSGVTRQDMAAFLYRLAGSPDFEPTEGQKAKFTDVDDSTPHAKEIWWLAKNGVSTGWDDGGGKAHFSGMSTVVRQDMAAFLHRLYDNVLAK